MTTAPAPCRGHTLVKRVVRKFLSDSFRPHIIESELERLDQDVSQQCVCPGVDVGLQGSLAAHDSCSSSLSGNVCFCLLVLRCPLLIAEAEGSVNTPRTGGLEVRHS